MHNPRATVTRARLNEDGLVSIIVVTTVIIILTLMTTGFAKIMDRELRQSLDRELAVQANYAAESGINDARNYIKNAAFADTSGDCLDTANLDPTTQQPYFVDKGSISSGANGLVKYTCINIDTQPKELVFDNIPAGTSKVFKVITSAPLDRLYFGWHNTNQDPSTATTLNGNPPNTQLPSESAFNALGGAGKPATGVLRASIYPVSNFFSAPGDQNANLQSISRTFFLYPNGSFSGNPGLSDYAAGNTIVAGNCKDTNFNNQQAPLSSGVKHFCNSAITGGLAYAPLLQVSYYYVKITALYHDLNVSVQATGNGANNSLSFKKAQATVDVTAKGNDVLKRLKGVVAIEPDLDYPQYALQSMDTVCKRIRLPVIGPNSYGIARYQDPDPGDSGVAEACGAGGTISP